MRLRPALVAALLVATLSHCGLEGTSDISGVPGMVSLAFRPILPAGFQLFTGSLTIAQVRLALVREPTDTIARSTRQLPDDSSSVRFALPVALTSQAESLLAVIEYQTSQGTTLFTGQVRVEARVGTASPVAPAVLLTYTGPGGNIASLTLSPFADTVAAGDSVSYQVTAIDSSQQPVSSFYVSWSTSDTRVPINALGLVRAPDITKVVDIAARTPNGTIAQVSLTILGTAALGLAPDSVEKLPSGQQQFTVAIGGSRGPYTWSVNGVDGGNTTFGIIDANGFYTAPSAVPNPSTFKVCARVTATPTEQGCATVVIATIPSAGADVIVFNDINMFANYSVLPGNAQLVKNLVTFTSTGPRASGNVALFDYTHNSRCNGSAECDFVTMLPMRNVITGQGMIVDTLPTNAVITGLPGNVKVIFMWTPQVAYDTAEINTFKLFAAQGGRIVFFGERLPYYGQFGIDSVENRFFREMGAQLVNVGADVALGAPYIVPIPVAGRHQIMAGVDSVGFSAASVIVPGPNDFGLVSDSTATADVLGAVAKIDLTPLPVPRYRPVRLHRRPLPPPETPGPPAAAGVLPLGARSQE